MTNRSVPPPSKLQSPTPNGAPKSPRPSLGEPMAPEKLPAAPRTPSFAPEDMEKRFSSAGISLRPIPTKAPSSRRNRMLAAAGLVMLGFAGGFLANQNKGCTTVTTVRTVEKLVPQSAEPKKGDGKCERKLGEGDLNPSTATIYDPDCGGCGNGKQDPGETVESCPGDFLCGNGKVDNVKVVRMVTLPNGVISQQVGTYNESCGKGDPNYCEKDCKPVPPKRQEKEPEDEIGIYERNGTSCPSYMVAGESQTASDFIANLRHTIMRKSDRIYAALAGDAGVPDIVLDFSFKVGHDGKITLDGVVPSCDAVPCDGKGDGIKELLGDALANGRLEPMVGAQACSWNLLIRVPKPK